MLTTYIILFSVLLHSICYLRILCLYSWEISFLCDDCLALVSGYYWLHRVSWEVFPPLFTGRVYKRLALILLLVLMQFASEAIWAWTFCCEKIFDYSISYRSIQIGISAWVSFGNLCVSGIHWRSNLLACSYIFLQIAFWTCVFYLTYWGVFVLRLILFYPFSFCKISLKIVRFFFRGCFLILWLQ